MPAKRYLVGVAIAALTFVLAETAARAAGIFTLSSTTFEDGKLMPKNVANNAANSHNNPNCVGENVLPQFSWTNVPEGAKSFVFLMTDPEGRAGAGIFRWVAYGIPVSVTGFAEGEVSKPSDKYVGGKSTQGVGFLFRAVHAAEYHAASLHVRARCDRFRAEGVAAWADAR